MILKKIVTARGSFKKKLKQLGFYVIRKRAAKKAWNCRHGIVFDKHPDFREPLNKEILKAHRSIWKPFNKNFNDATLKICRSISGTANPLIIPEEIFQADIEPSLNHHPEAHYLAHKSLYNRWFKKGIFPEDLLHLVDGELLDNKYNPLTRKQAEEICDSFSYPVVMKPNRETWGGNDILFVECAEELRRLINSKTNVVIQKKILQHPKLARYHVQSLNTVRVYLYRSVSDNKYHILSSVLRTGNGGPLDNVSAGGLVSRIKEDGLLHGYALDLYGGKFKTHPVSGLPFTGAIPDFEQLKELSMEIAQKLFFLRLVGLDLCYDVSGRWRAIEINTQGHSIRFAQYAGQPFFGEFSEEVIDYCKTHHWAVPEKSVIADTI